ncbi:hypothetical protein E2C01_062628 [Portunus trituberculatus]|uniref:Uncharacterized protein n=1 Tax=Portunus trituberculatus TaxID=210409 RepID=A0A5B7HFS7_PORTR|nr:hypothetical protein [Portunus trituberculatus]
MASPAEYEHLVARKLSGLPDLASCGRAVARVECKKSAGGEGRECQSGAWCACQGLEVLTDNKQRCKRHDGLGNPLRRYIH